jgi:serine protease AprX
LRHTPRTLGRRLLPFLTLLALLIGTLGGPGSAAAGDKSKVDPVLQHQAGKNPGAVVPVIIERTNDAAAVDAVKAKGGKVKRKLKARHGLVAEVAAGSLEALAQDPGVTRIAFDAPMAIKGEIDWDRRPLESIYPSVVGAPELWQTGVTGDGVGVAIVDSGLRDHDDFKGVDEKDRRRSGKSRMARRFAVEVEDQGGDDDDHGHGTWVAGIVAGRGWDDGDRKDQAVPGKYVGVAPGVKLIGVKVANKRGVSRLSDAVAGIEWVVANKDTYNIRVMNLSLVSTVAESYKTSLLDAAVEYAWFSGIVVVVAAGNEGPDTMRYPPANDPFAIVVGATDDYGTVDRADDDRVWFSSYGTTQDGVVKPDLVAPGRRIVSTLGKKDLPLGREFEDRITRGHYIRLSGTSGAAPVVSGVAALLLQVRPDLSPDQVKWLLQRTALPVPGPGTGAGYAHAGAAVGYAGEIGRANVGVEPSFYIQRAYLVSTGRLGATENGFDTSSWTENGWDTSSWTKNDWDTSSWTTSSWTTSSWTTSSWTTSSWTRNGWDTSSWTRNGWDTSSWTENGWDTSSWTSGRRVLGD